MPKIPKNVNLISSPNKFTLKKTKVYKNNRTSKVNFKSDFKLFAFVIFIIFSIYAVCILMKLEKTNKINEQNIFYSNQRRVKMYTKTPKQTIPSFHTSNTSKIPKNAINIFVKLKKPNKNNEQNLLYSVQLRIKMGTKAPKQTIASSHTSYINISKKLRLSETKIA